MLYRFIINALARVDGNLVRTFAYYYTCTYCLFYRFLAPGTHTPSPPVKVMGLSFPGPIGLAAGFDRDGYLLRNAADTGLGHVEIGTINIDSGKGPEPHAMRILRKLEHISIACPKGHRRQLWGISLGSRDPALTHRSAGDYAMGMELFWKHADYLVINMGSPDSPARATCPEMKTLCQFFHTLMQQHAKLTASHVEPAPIVIKITIDHSRNEHIIPILLLIREQGFDGTIIAFENWPDITSICEYLAVLRAELGSFPLVVVGGIRSKTDARRILNAGASLVQIHTSLVLRGPGYIRKMVKTL